MSAPLVRERTDGEARPARWLPRDAVLTLSWSLGLDGALGTLRWRVREAAPANDRAREGGGGACGLWQARAEHALPGQPAQGLSGWIDLLAEHDDELNLLHLDAGPELRITVRGRERPALLYARTHHLTRLGVLGGRAGVPELSAG